MTIYRGEIAVTNADGHTEPPRPGGIEPAEDALRIALDGGAARLLAYTDVDDLVDDDHDRDVEREHAPRDVAVAGADPLPGVDDEHDRVEIGGDRLLDAVLHPLGEPVERLLPAGQVDQHELGVVDVVTIASPPSCHGETGRQALAAGKHVLIEKPLATDVATGQRLVALAAEKKLALGCGHQERLVFQAMGLLNAPERPSLRAQRPHRRFGRSGCWRASIRRLKAANGTA
jgi:hypothetical protein